MTKPIRLLVLVIILTTLSLLSLSGAAWAGSLEQGTVPSGDTPPPPGPGETPGPGTCALRVEATQPPPPDIVTLNVCTGLAIIPHNAFSPAGKAVVEEVTTADLAELGAPPRGLHFLSNGLTLTMFTREGRAVRFFPRPVTVCFPFPPGQAGVIRMWDATLTPNRWVAFPTFRSTTSPSLICTRTRLPGTYAPIGR